MKRTRPSSRVAATIVEIVIAMAMLAAALVPIAQMLSGTASNTAATKAEAAAATYAATLMNYLLAKVDFDDPVLADGTRDSDTYTGTELPVPDPIDGVQIRWRLQVVDYMADDDALTFNHWRVRFNNIDDCPPPDGSDPANPPALPTFDASMIREVTDRKLIDLDAKSGEDDSGSVQAMLKEIRLTMQWTTPRAPDFEDVDGDTLTLRRTVPLVTRRARLERTAP